MRNGKSDVFWDTPLLCCKSTESPTRMVGTWKQHGNILLEHGSVLYPESCSRLDHTCPREVPMAALKGSKTENNLKEAFRGESQANRRYLYFARKADVEGYPDVAGVFRDTAEGETGHAFGHFDFLKEVGDPATGEPVGDTTTNLKSAVAGETYEYTQMYPGFAKVARDEGFSEIAEWFETLAKAEKSHAGRFTQALKNLQ